MQKRRVLVVDLEAKGESQGLRMLSSIRQAGVFGELLLAGQGFSVPDNAAGLVLLGGEGPDLPVVQACVRAQIPLLCFGGASRLLVEALGGSVGETALQDKVRDVHFSDLGVFQGVEGGFRVVQKACYLSLPEGLRILAGLEGVVLAFDDGTGRVTGMQFLPESQDMDVSSIVNHFLFKVLGLEAGYSLEGYRRWSLDFLRGQVGQGEALCVLSGGVDSSVAACLAIEALGERARCLLVDTGLLRSREADNVVELFTQRMGRPVHRVDAREETYQALRGLRTTEQKRRAVEAVIDRHVRQALEGMGEGASLIRGVHFQDVLGGQLPAGMGAARSVEPLRPLLKEEVRHLALLLGLPEELAFRRHYPAAGIALRCMGEADAPKLEALRAADEILQTAMADAGQRKHRMLYFAVLLDMPQTRENEEGGYVVALRVVQDAEQGHAPVARLSFDLLERISEEILSKLPQVRRVVYDLTACPPGQVEWA